MRFILKLKNKFNKFLVSDSQVSLPQQISQYDLVSRLTGISHWEKKIETYNRYEYSTRKGVWIKKAANPDKGKKDIERTCESKVIEANTSKVHYGCGENLMEGWLNIDLYESETENYYSINLLGKHPFEDNSVDFGFSEDVLEHLNQAQSIFFLSEIYRALKKNGAIRLSFPGLEGILKRHYTPCSELRVRQGEFEAYSFWDHIHFYSKEELRLVAEHIGFNGIKFFEYGKSSYPELCGIDTRADQTDLNTYVELTK